MEHVTSLPKRRVGALSTVSTVNHKEHPGDVDSDLKPSKQIIGHKTTYNGITAASKSSPDGTWHSEWHDVTVSIV